MYEKLSKNIFKDALIFWLNLALILELIASTFPPCGHSILYCFVNDFGWILEANFALTQKGISEDVGADVGAHVGGTRGPIDLYYFLDDVWDLFYEFWENVLSCSWILEGKWTQVGIDTKG